MPKINLTQQFCNNPTPPDAGKRKIEHCDTQYPGLLLEVRNTSPVGTYYLRYRNSANKTAYSKLGNAQEITLKEARTKAQQLKASIAGGSDPQAEARERKSSHRGHGFTDSYLPHAQQKKRTWKNDADMHERLWIGLVRPPSMPSPSKWYSSSTTNCEKAVWPLLRLTITQATPLCPNLRVDWEMLDKNPAAKVKQFNADNQGAVSLGRRAQEVIECP